MIMPGDVIVHCTASGVRFLVVAVQAFSRSKYLLLLYRDRFITRDLISVMGWLTCDMGYTLVRNGRPVTVVTNMV